MQYVERYPFAIRIDAAAAAEKRALQIRAATPTELATAQPLAEGTPALKRVAQPKTEASEAKPLACPEDADEAVKRVYEALVASEKTVTELARELTMTSADVLSALTELELSGVVSCTAGQRYKLNSKK